MEPISVFKNTMTRVKEIIKLARPGGRGRPGMPKTDVLRSAIVLAVSALDAYVSDIYKMHFVNCLTYQFNNGGPNPRMNNILKLLVKRQDNIFVFLINKNDCTEAIEEMIGDLNDNRSYQNPGTIENALGELGISDLWQRVTDRLSPGFIGDVKRRITEISQRRNDIVHRADIKPENTRATPINFEETNSMIKDIEIVVEAIDAIVCVDMNSLE